MGEEDATRICSAPCRPHDPASDRRRDPRASRVPPPRQVCFHTRNMYSSTITSHANRSRHSLRSCYNHGTANLCGDGCSTAPLLSFASAPASPGVRYRRTKLIWPPAAEGKIWTVAPPLKFDAERLAVSCPDNEMKPYGAPSVGRRGGSHAGASLLKGQEPGIRACVRLVWIK